MELVDELTIFRAKEKDFDLLIDLINSLEDFEKLERPDKEAQERLKNDLFSSIPKAYVDLASFDEKSVAYVEQ